MWTAQFKIYGRDHAVLRGRLFFRDTGSAWSTGIAGCSGLTVIWGGFPRLGGEGGGRGGGAHLGGPFPKDDSILGSRV